MATAVDVTSMRDVNRGIVALAQRDLAKFWDRLDLTDAASARDALLAFTPALTDQYGEIAASMAADWYDELRAAEGLRDLYVSQAAATVPTDIVQTRTRFGAQHLWSATPDQTLSFLNGMAAEYVLQPGRDTISQSAIRDPMASGWHRETRPGACDFCRLLAGRGGVYKKATANFSAHGECQCVAVPSWDASAAEVEVEQYIASERTSKMSAAQRAAHTARVRAFLADMAS